MAHRARQCLKATIAAVRGLDCAGEASLTCSSLSASFCLPAAQSTFDTQRRAYSRLVDQQLSVIAPASAGGPILRTPVYAIFELGSKQYKVSPGDVIWVERLKLVDVGSQLALNKVQVAGSLTETIVGRPYVENASVTAVVEV